MTERALFSSRSAEWYTPPAIVEAARAVLGRIDLDPASSAEANVTVRAARYFTEAEDGLAQPWLGRVFCNPPYGRVGGESSAALWTRKAIAEHRVGRVEAVVLLVNSTTDCRWFTELWDFPICFVASRIKFIAPGRGPAASPTHGSALVGIGVNERRFAAGFRRFGQVVLPRGEDALAVGPRSSASQARDESGHGSRSRD